MSEEGKVKREHGLKRAAQMRASIVSLLNNSATPMGRQAINAALNEQMVELGYKPNNFDNFLYDLSRNGLIKIIGKNPDGTGYIYAGGNYEGITMDLSKNTTKAATSPTKRKYTKRKSKENQTFSSNPLKSQPPIQAEEKVINVTSATQEPIAPVTVDIVKSSGRIRIAMGGISIEIGVVD